MTSPLNDQFRAALKRRNCWNFDRLRSALFACKERIAKAIVDWEKGDENWGRVLKNGEVVLLISALIPLAFVAYRSRDTVQEILGDCLAVAVESFSQEDFSIDSKLLEKLVGRAVSSNVNYNQLSIDDLWWATVS